MARKDRRVPDSGKKKPKKSAEQLCAEKIRYHKNLDSRWAILDEVRVEYFRGKDFVQLIRKHPDLVYSILPKDEVDALSEPQEQVVAEILLSQRLIVRCDRVVKTIRPGRKKLSSWPAKLEVHRSQRFAAEEGFYMWTFERQQPIWQTILTMLFPIFTVACCLFPVYPYWCKLAVLYFLLSLIAFLVGLLFVRWVVYGGIWIATGKRVWFFPRILQEEGSLAELFRFWPDKDEEPPAKMTTRVAIAGMVAFTVWLMVTYAPDEDTRARYQKRVTNIIDDFITWSPAMLAGKTTPPAEANATLLNSTAPNGTAANSSSSTAGSSHSGTAHDSGNQHHDAGDGSGTDSGSSQPNVTNPAQPSTEKSTPEDLEEAHEAGTGQQKGEGSRKDEL